MVSTLHVSVLPSTDSTLGNWNAKKKICSILWKALYTTNNNNHYYNNSKACRARQFLQSSAIIMLEQLPIPSFATRMHRCNSKYANNFSRWLYDTYNVHRYLCCLQSLDPPASDVGMFSVSNRESPFAMYRNNSGKSIFTIHWEMFKHFFLNLQTLLRRQVSLG